MGTGYTRNDTVNNIDDGNVIDAADLDGEFDAIQAAFNASTGHTHDGTTGEGPQIDTAGIANDAVDSDKLDETDSYTMAGLDVTGTVTADSLTVDGNVTFNTDAVNISDNIPKLIFTDTDTSTIASLTANSSHLVYDTASSARNHTFSQAGTARMEINSSGIDVTGTVTADGLTVDGNPTLNNTGDSLLNFTAFDGSQDTTAQIMTTRQDLSTSKSIFRIYNNNGSGLVRALETTGDNDISFYEDTGTTPKFFWDASAESLGIGTTSPLSLLHVGATTIPTWTDLTLQANTGWGSRIKFNDGSDSGIITYYHGDNSMRFTTNGSERMRIDSGGNVGIKTVPSAWNTFTASLQIDGSSLSGVGANNTALGSNVYYDSGWKYYGTGNASLYQQNSGLHRWDIAGSGTAGNAVTFTEAMRIASSGNVGIGTTSPSYNLHIESSGASEARVKTSGATSIARFTAENTTGAILVLASTGSGYNPYGLIGSSNAYIYSTSDIAIGADGAKVIKFGTGTGVPERMRIDSSGNLLVGKTSQGIANQGFEVISTGQTQITNNSGASLVLNRLTSDGDIAVFRKDGTTVGSIGVLGGQLDISGTTNGIRFGSQLEPMVSGTRTNNAVDLGSSVYGFRNLYLSGKITNNGTGGINIDTSGNVGIGTSSPAVDLHIVTSGAQPTRFESTGSSVFTSWTNSTGTIGYMGSADGLIASGSSSNLTVRAEGSLVFATNAGSERMRIDSSGNLLVGTATHYSSSYRMSIAPPAGTGGIVFRNNTTSGVPYAFLNTSNSTVGYISTSNTGTSYVSSSDYRLKEDWQPMSGSIDRVKALNPVNFAWISSGERVDGFLAHEAATVVPEAVTGEKDAVDADGNPEYQGIDQSKLVPLLTSALQEAIAKIETLETRIAALEN